MHWLILNCVLKLPCQKATKKPKTNDDVQTSIKSEQMDTDENQDENKMAIKNEETQSGIKESGKKVEKEDIKSNDNAKENDNTSSQSSKSIHSFFGKKRYF